MPLVRDVLFYVCIGVGLLWLYSCGVEAKPSAEVEKEEIVIPKSKLTLLHRIQGRWQDNTTPEAVIEVVGKKMLWVYQEVVLSEKEIAVHEEFPTICHGIAAKGGEGFFIAYRDGEGYCYQIMSIKDFIFDYRPLGPVKD